MAGTPICPKCGTVSVTRIKRPEYLDGLAKIAGQTGRYRWICGTKGCRFSGPRADFTRPAGRPEGIDNQGHPESHWREAEAEKE